MLKWKGEEIKRGIGFTYLEPPNSTSFRPSTIWWKSNTRWARSEIKRRPLQLRPVIFNASQHWHKGIWNNRLPWLSRESTSLKKEGRWTTKPDPINPVQEGLTRPWTKDIDYLRLNEKSNDSPLPLGNKWNANVLLTPSIGTTIVCPALFPPAHLAQTSTSADRISTSLPFPSSPHCEPRTTVTVSGMRYYCYCCFKNKMNIPLM